MKIILPSYSDLKTQNSFYGDEIAINETKFVDLLKKLNPSLIEQNAHTLFALINTNTKSRTQDPELSPQSNAQLIDGTEWENFWDFVADQSNVKTHCSSCIENISTKIEIDNSLLKRFFKSQLQRFDSDMALQTETGDTSNNFEKLKENYVNTVGQDLL